MRDDGPRTSADGAGSSPDSLVEGDGFELPVPREIGSISTFGEE